MKWQHKIKHIYIYIYRFRSHLATSESPPPRLCRNPSQAGKCGATVTTWTTRRATYGWHVHQRHHVTRAPPERASTSYGPDGPPGGMGRGPWIPCMVTWSCPSTGEVPNIPSIRRTCSTPVTISRIPLRATTTVYGPSSSSSFPARTMCSTTSVVGVHRRRRSGPGIFSRRWRGMRVRRVRVSRSSARIIW